jgi:hypothetical protein
MRRGSVDARLTGQDLGLHLTNRRLISFGRDRIFNVIPSGRKFGAALIEDVDFGGVRTKRLPTWLFVAGVLLLIGGLTLLLGGNDSSSGDSNSSAPMVVALLLGAALVLLFLLVRREVIVFYVAGEEAFELLMWRNAANPNDAEREASAFISNFFALKSDRAEPVFGGNN